MGYKVSGICEYLGIHEAAVYRRLANVRKKSGTQTNIQAVARAVGQKIIPPLFMLEPPDTETVLNHFHHDTGGFDLSGFLEMLETADPHIPPELHQAIRRLKTVYRHMART